jgi:hypothetical protein
MVAEVQTTLMMKNFRIRARMLLIALLWIARATSLLSISVLLAFFIGEGFDPRSVAFREWIGLLFFPFGIVAGMAICWWHELLGGAVAILSLGAFYMFNTIVAGSFPDGAAFAVFTLPAILFLLHGMLRRQRLSAG